MKNLQYLTLMLLVSITGIQYASSTIRRVVTNPATQNLARQLATSAHEIAPKIFTHKYKDNTTVETVTYPDTTEITRWYNKRNELDSIIKVYPNGTEEHSSYNNGTLEYRRVKYSDPELDDESILYNRFGCPCLMHLLQGNIELSSDVYIYDKEGNNVGAVGTYDANGLDRQDKDVNGKSPDLD